MIKLKITILVSVIILLLFLPVLFGLAQQPTGYTPQVSLPGFTPTSNPVQDFPNYIQALYRMFLGAAIIAAFLGLIIGGVEYMVSAGSTARQENAKGRIQDAVIGLLLVLGAVFLLQQISGSFTNITITLPTIAPPEALAFLNVSPNAGWNQSPPNTSCSLSNLSPYQLLINQAASQYGIDPARLESVILAESSGNSNAVSGSGAYGLMQILPSVAQNLDPSVAGLTLDQIAQKLKDPAYNIQLGAILYSTLLNQYGGNQDLASAAYNGGTVANQNSVDCPGELKWQCPWDNTAHTIPNTGFAETRNYVSVIDQLQSKIQNGQCQ